MGEWGIRTSYPRNPWSSTSTTCYPKETKGAVHRGTHLDFDQHSARLFRVAGRWARVIDVDVEVGCDAKAARNDFPLRHPGPGP